MQAVGWATSALLGEIGRLFPSNSLLRRLWRLTVRERDACVLGDVMSRHSVLLACFCGCHA
jgi:hypothetical protein